jgi:hypothetical protein
VELVFAAMVSNNPDLVLFVAHHKLTGVAHIDLACPSSLIEDMAAKIVLPSMGKGSIDSDGIFRRKINKSSCRDTQ